MKGDYKPSIQLGPVTWFKGVYTMKTDSRGYVIERNGLPVDLSNEPDWKIPPAYKTEAAIVKVR